MNISYVIDLVAMVLGGAAVSSEFLDAYDANVSIEFL